MDIPSMELDNGKGMDSDRFEWFFGWCIILCAIQHDLHIMNIYSYISNIYIFIHYICPWSIWKDLLWQVSSPQWKETHPAILLVTGKDTEKSLREKNINKNTKGKNPTEFMTSKASPNSQGSRNRSGAKDDGRCHLPCGWPVGCCLCSWLSRRAWSKKT